MEAYSLQYLPSYAVLLCRDHGYCVRLGGYETHLRRLHAARGDMLKRAIEAIQNLPPLPQPDAVQKPSPEAAPISGLTIASGYRCAIDDCGLITPDSRAIQHHQSKVHAVGPKKPHRRTEPMTDVISFQSFFPKPFFRPFVVDHLRSSEQTSSVHTSVSASRESTCSPSSRAEDELSLEEHYARSQKEWQDSFASFGQSTSVHESQTAPWLLDSGIAAFIRRLDLTKEEIPKLIRPKENVFLGTACGFYSMQSELTRRRTLEADYLVQQCVLYRLTQYRRMCRPGSSRSTANRPTLRALNTFEPNRANTEPFTGVQDVATLKRYSDHWGRMLLFLIFIASSHDVEALSNLLFGHNSDLRAQVSTVSRAAKRLHAVVTEEQSDFSSCLRSPSSHAPATDEDSSSEQDSDASVRANPRRIRACRLLHAVTELSVMLVRQEYETDAFGCSVTSFTALHTLDGYGAWKAGASFAPMLSAMIHCMQLWLLGACVAECDDSPHNLKGLQKYTQAQCQRYLVNTNSCPIADLSQWRLQAWSARKDNVRAPSTVVSPDRTQVIHQSIVLKLAEWREVLQQLVSQATEVLEEELLCGIKEAPRYSLANLQDSFGDSMPGHSFLNNPANELHAVKDWLYKQVRGNPGLWEHFHRAGRPRQSNMDIYLHANQRFLRLLAVLMYWTSGLPARRKELLGISWCNQEFPRNLYIHFGFVVMITGYHKSQWKVGTRPIARALAPAVGELLVKYLVYIPSFLRFVNHCVQSPSHAVSSDGLRGYLFSSSAGVWTPDQWGNCLKRHCASSLGFAITTRQWRHIAIALDRAVLQGVGCKTHGVSEHFGEKALHAVEDSASELDGEDNGPEALGSHSRFALHHMQASHTSRTNATTYGNSLTTTLGLTDTLLAAFVSVSQQWHGVCSMQLPATTDPALGSHKRSISASATSLGVEKRLAIRSHITVRRELWTWPALEQALQKLLGVKAQPRSIEQRQGLMLTARSRPETLLIMPTGGGKTLMYVVPTLLPMAQVTVVICPLVAARVDLLRRCKQWNIDPTIYRPGLVNEHQLHAISSLLLVDVDLAVTDSFVAVFRALHGCGRLDRLVIDEAHLILTAAHYRQNLGLLGVLRRVGCPILCLTATLPPVEGERALKESLHFMQTEKLRVSSDRVNLQYCIQSLSLDRFEGSFHVAREELLLRAALEICQNDIQRWTHEARTARSTARSICYVREKSLGARLAEQLHADFYYGELSSFERDRMWSAWSDGQTSPVLVASSALGVGVDYASVRRVLHLDAPSGLADYGQETGRAGRDGLHAVCTVLLPPRWKVTWDTGYRSDFLTEDRQQMTRYLQGQKCLRFLLTAYLDGWIDGRKGVTCNEDQTRCSVCIRGAKPASVTASSPEAAKSPARMGFVTTADTDTMDEVFDSDLNSNLMQLPMPDQEVDSMQSIRDELDIYDAASQLSHTATVEHQKAYALYETRAIRWGRSCIPCSFVHAVQVDGAHPDCVQGSHAVSFKDLRLNLRFTKFSACYSCGQPLFLCSNRGNGVCKQPDLVWQVCWTACSLDTKYGSSIIQALGGPEVEVDLFVKRKTEYLKWLGGKSTLFKLPCSNAARLTYQWLDRLEERCTNYETYFN